MPLYLTRPTHRGSAPLPWCATRSTSTRRRIIPSSARATRTSRRSRPFPRARASTDPDPLLTCRSGQRQLRQREHLVCRHSLLQEGLARLAIPSVSAGVRPLSPARATPAVRHTGICSDFRKPSDGLEPSTPSLPWRICLARRRLGIALYMAVPQQLQGFARDGEGCLNRLELPRRTRNLSPRRVPNLLLMRWWTFDDGRTFCLTAGRAFLHV